MSLTMDNLTLTGTQVFQGLPASLYGDLLKPRRAVNYVTSNPSSIGTVISTSYAENDPPAYIKYFQEGLRHSDEGNWRRAADAFAKSVELRPNFFQGNFNLGSAYANLGDDERAFKFFSKAVELHSDEPLAQYYLGLIAGMLGKVDVALTSLTKAERLGLELSAERTEELARAYFTVGYELTAQAERERQNSHVAAITFWRKAEKMLSRAVELYPNLVEAHFLLGKTYTHLASGSPETSPDWESLLDRALSAYEKATSTDPIIASWAYTEMGVLWSRRGSLTRALELFEKAIESDPNNVQATYNFGLVLLMTEQWRRAVEAFIKVIALRPRDASAHLWLGTAYASIEDFEEAEAALTQALKIDPHDAQALINLGVVTYKQGRLEEAESIIRQALDISPQNEIATRLLAELTLDRFEQERQPLAKRKLTPISSLYVLQNPTQIATFIVENSALLDLLREAAKHIRSIFGEDAKLSLRLGWEPEFTDTQTLYIDILTKMSVNDAFPLLERLDDEWWVDASEHASGIMNIKLQYV